MITKRCSSMNECVRTKLTSCCGRMIIWGISAASSALLAGIPQTSVCGHCGHYSCRVCAGRSPSLNKATRTFSRKPTKMQFKKVTHVIFDMDGLLIESESIYDKIIGDIVGQYGKEYTSDIKIKVLGTPEPDTARIVISEMNLPLSPEEFLDEYHQRVRKELTNPSLMPGAKELVKHFHKNEIPIAVATSSSQESMELKTKNHQDVFKLFHHIVCGSTDTEVKHGKPAPDIFLVCASRFPDKPHPSQCLVFEDAPNGVLGAIRAGMQAVMVPADYVGEELRKPATLVLKSLNEFKPDVFGLPARE